MSNEHRPTVDLDDDRDDEHSSENEASIREIDENTEASEEFRLDDEDQAEERSEERAARRDDSHEAPES